MGRFPDDVALQTIREVRAMLDGESAMMQITRRINVLVLVTMIVKYVHVHYQRKFSGRNFRVTDF